MLRHYAFKAFCPNIADKASKIGLNPNCYNYRALSDPRRDGQYLHVSVDADGVVLFSKFMSLQQILDSATEVTVIR